MDALLEYCCIIICGTHAQRFIGLHLLQNRLPMKCAFTFNGQHYLAPSKKEAKRFLKFFRHRGRPMRIKTTWRLRHVERAPSFCQIIKLNYDKVEFSII
jgi:hypothetical protein